MSKAMHLCLLAPVPAEHVGSALDVADKGYAVAFGTGSFDYDDGPAAMWQFFSKFEEEGLLGILPVYIHASASGSTGNGYFIGPKVSFTGYLEDWKEANMAGKHEFSAERPSSTLKTDGRWSGFWRVRNFRLLPKDRQLHLGDFRTARNGVPNAVVTTLRGPTRAFAPEGIMSGQTPA